MGSLELSRKVLRLRIVEDYSHHLMKVRDSVEMMMMNVEAGKRRSRNRKLNGDKLVLFWI